MTDSSTIGRWAGLHMKSFPRPINLEGHLASAADGAMKAIPHSRGLRKVPRMGGGARGVVRSPSLKIGPVSVWLPTAWPAWCRFRDKNTDPFDRVISVSVLDQDEVINL